MKKPSKFYYGAKTYGELNNIKMNWFRAFIKVILPFRIFFGILSVISFSGRLYNIYSVTGKKWYTDNFMYPYFIILIIQFVLLCCTYNKMKNLESEGYKSFIAYMIMELISITLSYLYAYEIIVAIIPISIYIIIWFVPNYIYFKKRKSIFGLNFETQIDNTNNNKHNEKIEQIWTSIKPEITDKIFQNNKKQASKIIISLSQMLNINLEKCDTKQYIYILSIYCDVFTWKIDKKASDKLIISSLQAHRKNYITSDYIAKNVLDFCVNNISKNGFTIPSSSNENLSNNSECKNNKYTFCNKCGNKLDDDFSFCNKCGHKVR